MTSTPTPQPPRHQPAPTPPPNRPTRSKAEIRIKAVELAIAATGPRGGVDFGLARRIESYVTGEAS